MCVVEHGSHGPHLASEHLKCDQYTWEIELIFLFKLK